MKNLKYLLAGLSIVSMAPYDLSTIRNTFKNIEEVLGTFKSESKALIFAKIESLNEDDSNINIMKAIDVSLNCMLRKFGSLKEIPEASKASFKMKVSQITNMILNESTARPEDWVNNSQKNNFMKSIIETIDGMSIENSEAAIA